jgi:DEAD/DEAH box helicase
VYRVLHLHVCVCMVGSELQSPAASKLQFLCRSSVLNRSAKLTQHSQEIPRRAGVVLAMQEKAAQLRAGPSVLVLSPTRELAAQTMRVLKLLVPGMAMKASLLAKSTAAGTDFSKVDMLMATPLLLVEMLQQDKVRNQVTPNRRSTVPGLTACAPP